MRRCSLLALVLLVGVAACRPPAPTVRRLALAPCVLSAPGRSERAQVQCGWLTVPEDRSQPGGRTLRLHVAVVPATSAPVAGAPLFLIAGGPGQGLSREYPRMAGLFAGLNERRDLVLVDQRGTGRSAPLDCPPSEDLDEPPSRLAERLQACRTRLSAGGARDLGAYGTAAAIEDLDDVRAALGYERINLYGGSYGTRVALAYVRQHPDRVRSLILDGVAPPGWLIGPDVAADAQRALDLHVARCAREPACAAAFPALGAALPALLARLQRAPETVTVAHPVTAEATRVTLTRDLVAGIVRAYSYSSETASLIPLLIHNAHTTGDLGPLAAQALLVRDLMPLSEAMHMTVICAEDVPFMNLDEARRRSAGTYLGVAMLDAYDAVCRSWPRGSVPAGFHEPFAANVPALVLSGEVDPVTPPRNGEAVLRMLPQARHLVLTGEAHGIVYRGCVQRLVRDFIERGTALGLDTSCMSFHRPLAYFTSFKGPPP